MSGSVAAVLAILLGRAVPAVIPAHQLWTDGTPVPEWVRNACCGPSDLHHLRPAQVHRMPGRYAVEGLPDLVPFAKTLPSQDGDYWIFDRTFDDGTHYVFCFFAPPEGS